MNGQADNVHWENANISGIQVQADAWHAGRCNDVVALSQDSYLIASDTGGVWYATLGAGGANLPLTDSWDNPNVTCLAEGSNHRFYAGCGRAGALFESSPGNASFWFPIDLQQDAGAINRIRIANSLQRIVLACDNGIFWSDIPAPSAGQGYTFKPATGVPRTVFSDIALGPGDSVVAALWGSEPSMHNPARSGGIIRLAWTAADLVMSAAAALPADVHPGEMGRTSLAACQSKPGHMYAITAGARPPGDARTFVLAILRSDDGGASWRKCDVSAQGAFATGDVTQLAGKQGGRNQCIAVAPNDPEVVAFGWQAGPFLSTRGGLAFGGPAWRVVAPRGSPHLHADVHALYFDPSTPRRALICSDGGVVVMPNFMEDNFISIANRYLANLQFESNPVRGSQSGARFSALHHAGTELIAGGLQDNGNVYSRLGPQATPWRHIETGDGRLMMLFSRSSPQNVQGDIHVLCFNNGDANARIATWDPMQAAFNVDGAVPVRRPGPSQARFLEAPVVGRIKRPGYRRVFRSPATMMYAVAGKGNEVYGLFGTLALPTLAPLDAGWELLGTLPLMDDEITAIDSLTGLTVFVGTRSGRIFALDAASGNPLELIVPADGAGEIQRLLELPNGRAFATVLREEGIVRSHRVGLVLRLFGSFKWEVLRGGGLPKGDVVYSLEGALGLAMVFVATDKSVYMSRDNGDHWQQAASGLPARPLCSDLSFASDGTNHFMYLSTFGRSVWRARLTLA